MTSKYVVVKVNLEDVDVIVKHRNALLKYINNYVSPITKYVLDSIKVKMAKDVLFQISYNDVSLNYILARTNIYFDKNNVNYQIYNVDYSEFDYKKGLVSLTDGVLKAYLKSESSVVIKRLNGLKTNLLLSNLPIRRAASFIITDIYIVGNNIAVTELFKTLRYFLLKEGSNEFDNELYYYLNTLNPNARVIGISNNTAIDLMNLKYLEAIKDDLLLRTYALTNALQVETLETNLDEYANIKDFELKSINLLKSINY